ncbi:MAG: glycosyltransferase [Chloroflexota bacterium]
MRILFIVPYAPNLIRTRPYNLIRYLNEGGHEVTLLTLYSSAEEQQDLTTLQNAGVRVISEPLSRSRSLLNSAGAFWTPEPLQAAYCWQPALAHRIDEVLRPVNGQPPVDVIHVEHLRGARYALHALTATRQIRPTNESHTVSDKHAIPVVWDSVDCISHLFQQAKTQSKSRFGRWITRFDLPRTEHYEGWLAWQFDTVLTTSTVDQEALLQLASAYRTGSPVIEVLPNGVDLDYFKPDPSVIREPATLVLSGKMSYHANVSMAVHLIDEIMPLVWAKRPDVQVQIVGKDPAPQVQALAAHPQVIVTGTVPDVRLYLQKATVAVAPITYGAGVQNKILEAMACATPVVATPIAARSLSTGPNHEILIGRDAVEFAAAILSLLEDPGWRTRVGDSGRAYVEVHHRWSRIVESLVKTYDTLILDSRTRGVKDATTQIDS